MDMEYSVQQAKEEIGQPSLELVSGTDEDTVLSLISIDPEPDGFSSANAPEWRCLICYSILPLCTKATLRADAESLQLLCVFKVLKLNASRKVASFVETLTDQNAPLCPVCQEILAKTRDLAEQVEELERTWGFFREEVFEKLKNSFEESGIHDYTDYGDGDETAEPIDQMITAVDQLRVEIINDIGKQIVKKKPGRPKKKKHSIEDSIPSKSSKSTSFWTKNEEELFVKPLRSSKRFQSSSEQQQPPRTSSGRVVRRPKLFAQNCEEFEGEKYEEDSKNESHSDAATNLNSSTLIHPSMVKLELVEEPEEKFFACLDSDSPDPEWSPSQEGLVRQKDSPFSSSNSDFEDDDVLGDELDCLFHNEPNEDQELVVHEGLSATFKGSKRILDDKKDWKEVIAKAVSQCRSMSAKKMKKKPRQSGTITGRNRVKIKNLISKIPVNLLAEDGQTYDGFYVMPDEVESDAVQQQLSFNKDVQAGSVLSFNEEGLTGVRIKCSEEKCPRSFSTLSKMKLHVETQHLGIRKPFTCSVCDKTFKRQVLLTKHKLLEHGAKYAESKSTLKKVLICEIPDCGLTFRNKSELQTHTRVVHTGERPFQCSHCNEFFVTTIKREFHIELIHPSEPPLRCTHKACPRGYFRAHRLRDHIKSHTGEKSYLCEICSKSFSQPAYLRYHQTKHKELELEPYKCDLCDRNFATPVNLKLHQQTQHRKEYRFYCQICKHGSTHMSHLKLHMRTHSGERPYVCNTCNKSFSRGSQLKIHIRSHTGERPYQCSTCSKDFTNSSKLRRHELTHKNEKPFKCPECEKGFTQAVNLAAHIRTNHISIEGGNSKARKAAAVTAAALVKAEVERERGSREINPVHEEQMYPDHQLFSIPESGSLPIQFQVVANSSDPLADGAEPYTEFIILNQV